MRNQAQKTSNHTMKRNNETRGRDFSRVFMNQFMCACVCVPRLGCVCLSLFFLYLNLIKAKQLFSLIANVFLAKICHK